jgi:hypothetical protein
MFGPLSKAFSATLAAGLIFTFARAGEPVASSVEEAAAFNAAEARQGVAVDDRFFYAIDSRAIAKHDKPTGRRIAIWVAPDDGSIVHLNSGLVVGGRLYAAHSNYPDLPPANSVEIWDTATLRHIGTHRFGVEQGWLTWLDYHGGAWWGGFANYNWPFGGMIPLASGNEHTQIVRFDPEWRIVKSWSLPQALLARFGDMSNSGGSWGPDGRLWITGHDRPEAYGLMLPKDGSAVRWVGTVKLDIAGQGIAWDRQDRDVIWGVVRNDLKGRSRVTASRVKVR